MLIALDFDGTYTADHGLWRAFLRTAEFRGHKVYVVTLRDKEKDYLEEFDYLKKEYGVDTIFCSGHSKRQVTQDHGLFFDVWIDDQPEFIPKGVERLDMSSWRTGYTSSIST